MDHHISVSTSAASAAHPRATVSWDDLATALSSFRTGPKDGRTWTVAAFVGNTRSRAAVESATLLALDVDPKPQVDYTPPWSALEGLQYLAHTTHSGGWRVVVALDRPVSRDEYQRLHATLSAALVDEGWQHLDPSVGKPEQPLYTPTVGPCGRKETRSGFGVPLCVDAVLKHAHAPAPAPAPLDLADLVARTRGVARDFLLSKLVIAQGRRDAELTRVAGTLAEAARTPTPPGTFDTLVLGLVARCPENFPEGAAHWVKVFNEKLARFTAVRVHNDALAACVPAPAAAVSQDAAATVTDDDGSTWEDTLIKRARKDGSFEVSPKGTNILTILRHDPEFRGVHWDSMRATMVATSGPLKGWSQDNAGNRISVWLINSKYRLDVSAIECDRQLGTLLEERQIDPLQVFFDNLPEHDGVPRISGLLAERCGVEGHPTTTALISRKFLVSAAARALSPGCQADSMLVLSGRGGVGKSTFVRALGGLFSTASNISIDKDAQMLLARSWLVELAEMTSARDIDKKSVRGFLTRREDEFRPPYGRAFQRKPRHCVFIGTTNSDMPIEDAEGARRYWPVTVGKIDTAWIEENREQIWAEAKAAFLAGETWYFDKQEELAYLEEQTNMYKEESALADLLTEHFSTMKDSQRRPHYSTIDLCKIIGVNVTDRGVKQQLGLAVREVGFMRRWRYVRGRKSTSYEPPACWAPGARVTETGNSLSAVPSSDEGVPSWRANM